MTPSIVNRQSSIVNRQSEIIMSFGELSLIKQFRANAPAHPWITVGPGQDCAILRWEQDRDVAFKIDQIIEGTHFEISGPNAVPPSRIGWKAMAKACSDIAATGFWPVAATVAINLRKGSSEQLAVEIYQGLIDCCARYQFGLAGGDVSVSENGLAIVVSLLGEGPKNGAWLRRGAQVGDALLVTGALGGSRASKHLRFMPRLDEARLIRKLVPDGIHACIDITDGLARDLRHICEESRCGALVYEDQIPISDDTLQFVNGPRGRNALDQALADGEDFELLLAVDPKAVQKLLDWPHATKITRIGEIQSADNGCALVKSNGQRHPLPDVGYEHRT
ncbi:MAG: thiamine-phosphate kinase [Planctomycetota bacterium]